MATNSQIERIKKAEKAMQQLLDYPAKTRRELEDIEDPDQRREAIEAIEGIERETKNLEEALRRWRLDIH